MAFTCLQQIILYKTEIIKNNFKRFNFMLTHEQNGDIIGVVHLGSKNIEKISGNLRKKSSR